MSLRFCKENCGDISCPYEVCPFAHVYTERDEICSGYRYVTDPVREDENNDQY